MYGEIINEIITNLSGCTFVPDGLDILAGVLAE